MNPSTTNLTFTKCGITELETLRELAIATFTEAFASQNDPKDFEDYMASAFSEEQLTTELNDPNSSFFFIAQSAAPIGYFKINVLQAQNEFRDPSGMELERIYIASEFQGRGLGSQILSYIEKLAKKMDKDHIWLGVWEKNVEAMRFYERNGYVNVGSHAYYIGRDKQNDWLLKKVLR